MIIDLRDKMNPQQFFTAEQRASAVAYDFRALTGSESIALADYRKRWKPADAAQLGFDLSSPDAIYRMVHVKLRRWTARGLGPIEIGVAVLDAITDGSIAAHLKPASDPVDGAMLYLCFMPHCLPGATRLQYPLGYKDKIEVIGEWDSRNGGDGVDSWFDRNKDFFREWISLSSVDKNGGSDPVFMGEYIKSRGEKLGNFTWRHALHQSNKVTSAYRSLWESAYVPIDSALRDEDNLLAMVRLTSLIEETGFDWFPLEAGVQHVRGALNPVM